MIEAISFSHEVPEYKSLAKDNFGLSDAKIKQIALVFFAAITFTIGLLALSLGTPIANFIAIASFTASGTLVWLISKIKNYDDPAELRQYQRDAKSMTLHEIIKEHGWSNMMVYEIPLAEDFTRKFRNAVKPMNVTAAIRFYEVAKKAQEANKGPYTLPNPSELKDKFTAEVKTMEATTIFEEYDVDELCKYGIASKALKEAKDQYQKTVKGTKKSMEQVELHCVKELRLALTTFRKVLEQARGSTPTQVGWIKQLKKEAEYLAKSNSNAWFTGSLEIMKEHEVPDGYELEESLRSLFTAHQAFIKAAKAAKKQRDRNIAILDEVLRNQKETTNAPFREETNA